MLNYSFNQYLAHSRFWKQPLNKI